MNRAGCMLLALYLCTASVAAQPAMATADTLHALVVFAKFRDDTEPGDPAVAFRQWPLFEDPGRLPPFADALLAPSPEPPYPDTSLTAYFHRQSQGRFVLYGTVYDSVLVSRFGEARYHRPEGGYGHLTKELLDRIDGYGFDFTRFDHNGDGLLDYLFVIVRRDSRRDDKTFTWTGISCLDATCGGGIAGGRPSGQLVYDGLRLDWQRSGAILMHRTPGNIIPLYYHVRLMAHELGHDLWAPFFNHIPAITDNDVPARSNRSRRGTDVIGYALMAGAGGGWDARGDEAISAFERDLLGWINCLPIEPEQATIQLSDLYTTGDCRTLHLVSGRRLYLSNRQRLGAFDRQRLGGAEHQFEMGLLRTTGLLVTLVDGTRFDVLPADGTLDLATDNATYQGDLFGPNTQSQLTPWTRPNTSGYMHYPPGYAPDWQALDRIRNAEGGTMAFEYLPDFRERSTIRSESWIGDETRGQTLDAPVVVTNSATLHVETALTLATGLRVEPGAAVIVAPAGNLVLAPGAVLELGFGARVIVEGRLLFDGLAHRSPGAVLVPHGAGLIVVR